MLALRLEHISDNFCVRVGMMQVVAGSSLTALVRSDTSGITVDCYSLAGEALCHVDGLPADATLEDVEDALKAELGVGWFFFDIFDDSKQVESKSSELARAHGRTWDKAFSSLFACRAWVLLYETPPAPPLLEQERV